MLPAFCFVGHPLPRYANASDGHYEDCAPGGIFSVLFRTLPGFLRVCDCCLPSSSWYLQSWEDLHSWDFKLSLISWVYVRRYFAAAIFLLFALVAWRLEIVGLHYASYKLFYRFVPHGWCFSVRPGLQEARTMYCVTLAGDSSGGATFLSSQRVQDLISLLLGLCIPGLLLGTALRSGFSFCDFKMASGMNDAVEGRLPMLLRKMTVRTNDVTRARAIADLAKPHDGVLFSNFSRDDVGYFAHFFRDRSIWMLNGYNFVASSERTPGSFSENMRPLLPDKRLIG